MADLVVLVPVLARPHRVAPLIESLERTTEDCRLVFIADPDDEHEKRAIARAGAECLLVDGGYAKKINAGVRGTTERLIFLGADDLDFKPGWLEVAESYLTDKVQVVGVNDLISRERVHSTHFLLTRKYAEWPTISNGPGPLHDGYAAWYCDDELIATATSRGAYAYAEESEVEHLHPMAQKAEDDETYRLGRAHRRHDARLFFERQKLWT